MKSRPVHARSVVAVRRLTLAMLDFLWHNSSPPRLAWMPMSNSLAYINGQLLPEREARLPLFDTGFVLGVTVAEQLRTFQGNLFRLDDHLDRLHQALEYLEIELEETRSELAARAGDLAAHNYRQLDAGSDLGLVLFATPGPYPTLAASLGGAATLGMHTYPLPFELWADRYEAGQSVVISSVPQVPAECWPRDLKCRSRLHYFLADREARRSDPRSRAILVDDNDCILEATTANVVMVSEAEGLVAPPREKTLPGISLQMVETLAGILNISFSERDISRRELMDAEEVILTSTPWCLLPVVLVDGAVIRDGNPGPTYRRLLRAWGDSVGVDIANQARTICIR